MGVGASGGTSQSSAQNIQNSVFSPPPWTVAAGQQAVQAAQSLAQMPFEIPPQPIAPLQPQQSEAFQTVENLQGAYTPYVDAALSGLPRASQFIQQGSQNPFTLPAAFFQTPQGATQYFNAEAAGVVPQLENIFGQQTAQQVGNLVQSAGGVGADRIAVGQSELANQQGLAAGQTLSQLMGQAVTQGQTAGTNLAQIGAENSQLLQAAGSGIGNLATAGGNLANLGQTMGLTGAQAELNAGNLQQQQLQNQQNALYSNDLQAISWPFQTNEYLGALTSGITPSMGGSGISSGIQNVQSSNLSGNVSGSGKGAMSAMGGGKGGASGGRVGMGGGSIGGYQTGGAVRDYTYDEFGNRTPKTGTTAPDLSGVYRKFFEGHTGDAVKELRKDPRGNAIWDDNHGTYYKDEGALHEGGPFGGAFSTHENAGAPGWASNPFGLSDNPSSTPNTYVPHANQTVEQPLPPPPPPSDESTPTSARGGSVNPFQLGGGINAGPRSNEVSYSMGSPSLNPYQYLTALSPQQMRSGMGSFVPKVAEGGRIPMQMGGGMGKGSSQQGPGNEPGQSLAADQAALAGSQGFEQGIGLPLEEMTSTGNMNAQLQSDNPLYGMGNEGARIGDVVWDPKINQFVDVAQGNIPIGTIPPPAVPPPIVEAFPTQVSYAAGAGAPVLPNRNPNLGGQGPVGFPSTIYPVETAYNLDMGSPQAGDMAQTAWLSGMLSNPYYARGGPDPNNPGFIQQAGALPGNAQGVNNANLPGQGGFTEGQVIANTGGLGAQGGTPFTTAPSNGIGGGGQGPLVQSPGQQVPVSTLGGDVPGTGGHQQIVNVLGEPQPATSGTQPAFPQFGTGSFYPGPSGPFPEVNPPTTLQGIQQGTQVAAPQLMYQMEQQPFFRGYWQQRSQAGPQGLGIPNPGQTGVGQMEPTAAYAQGLMSLLGERSALQGASQFPSGQGIGGGATAATQAAPTFGSYNLSGLPTMPMGGVGGAGMGGAGFGDTPISWESVLNGPWAGGTGGSWGGPWAGMTGRGGFGPAINANIPQGVPTPHNFEASLPTAPSKTALGGRTPFQSGGTTNAIENPPQTGDINSISTQYAGLPAGWHQVGQGNTETTAQFRDFPQGDTVLAANDVGFAAGSPFGGNTPTMAEMFSLNQAGGWLDSQGDAILPGGPNPGQFATPWFLTENSGANTQPKSPWTYQDAARMAMSNPSGVTGGATGTTSGKGGASQGMPTMGGMMSNLTGSMGSLGGGGGSGAKGAGGGGASATPWQLASGGRIPMQAGGGATAAAQAAPTFGVNNLPPGYQAMLGGGKGSTPPNSGNASIGTDPFTGQPLTGVNSAGQPTSWGWGATSPNTITPWPTPSGTGEFDTWGGINQWNKNLPTQTPPGFAGLEKLSPFARWSGLGGPGFGTQSGQATDPQAGITGNPFGHGAGLPWNYGTNSYTIQNPFNVNPQSGQALNNVSGGMLQNMLFGSQFQQGGAANQTDLTSGGISPQQGPQGIPNMTSGDPTSLGGSGPVMSAMSNPIPHSGAGLGPVMNLNKQGAATNQQAAMQAAQQKPGGGGGGSPGGGGGKGGGKGGQKQAQPAQPQQNQGNQPAAQPPGQPPGQPGAQQGTPGGMGTSDPGLMPGASPMGPPSTGFSPTGGVAAAATGSPMSPVSPFGAGSAMASAASPEMGMQETMAMGQEAQQATATQMADMGDMGGGSGAGGGGGDTGGGGGDIGGGGDFGYRGGRFGYGGVAGRALRLARQAGGAVTPDEQNAMGQGTIPPRRGGWSAKDLATALKQSNEKAVMGGLPGSDPGAMARMQGSNPIMIPGKKTYYPPVYHRMQEGGDPNDQPDMSLPKPVSKFSGFDITDSSQKAANNGPNISRTRSSGLLSDPTASPATRAVQVAKNSVSDAPLLASARPTQVSTPRVPDIALPKPGSQSLTATQHPQSGGGGGPQGGAPFPSAPAGGNTHGYGNPTPEVNGWIDNALAQPGVDPSLSRPYMRAIAGIESGFDPHNVTGQYRGLYQMGTNGNPNTGGDEWARYGQGRDVMNGQDNANAYARMASDHASQLRNAGVDVTPQNLYMTHQQGLGAVVNGHANAGNMGNNTFPGMPAAARGNFQAFGNAWGERINDLMQAYQDPSIGGSGPNVQTQTAMPAPEGGAETASAPSIGDSEEWRGGAVGRALRAARGARVFQVGGTTPGQDEPDKNQNAYANAISQEMGPNAAGYMKNAVWQGANQTQNQALGNNPQTEQQPLGGPPPVQSGAAPPVGGQPAMPVTPPPPSGGGGGPQAGAPATPVTPPHPSVISQQAMKALGTEISDRAEASQKPQPPKNEIPAHNDKNLNEQEAMRKVEAVSGVEDTIKQRNARDIGKNLAEGLSKLFAHQPVNPSTQQQTPALDPLRRIFGGQQTPTPADHAVQTAKQLAQPQQWDTKNLLAPSLTAGIQPNEPPSSVKAMPGLEGARGVKPQPFTTAKQAPPGSAAIPTPTTATPVPPTQPAEPPGVQKARTWLGSNRGKTLEQLSQDSGHPLPAMTPPGIRNFVPDYRYDVKAQVQNLLAGYPGASGYTDQVTDLYNKSFKALGFTPNELYAATKPPPKSTETPATTVTAKEPTTKPTTATAEQPARRLPWGDVPYKVGSGVGENRGSHTHQGTDIVMPHGTPLKAPADGTITGWNPRGSMQSDQGPGAQGGGWLNIRGKDGKTYSYGHVDLSPELQKRWDAGERNIPVTANDVVASSGTANGVQHLHMEAWAGERQHSQLLDPVKEFNLQGTPGSTEVASGPGTRVSATAGSAGRGTPEQETRNKQLAFQSWWRELVGGDPMLPYARENAKLGLYNAWTDWDAKRNVAYGNLSPTDAAHAAVGPGGELESHKKLDGEVKSAQGDLGQTHPGGHTLTGGGSGQSAKEAYAALPPEQQAVANQIETTARMINAGRQLQNAQRGSPYWTKGYEMEMAANKELAALAQTEAATTLQRQSARMQGWIPGQFGWTNLLTGEQRSTLPAAAQPKQETAPPIERPATHEGATAPANPPAAAQAIAPAASIGAGTPVPPSSQAPVQQIPGAIPAMPAGAMQSSTAGKPIPASEEEKRAQQPRQAQPAQPSGYSETDVLQHPMLDTRITPQTAGRASERDVDPRYSLFDMKTGSPEGAKMVMEEYTKESGEARKNAEQSSQKMGRIVAIQQQLARLREADMGWGSGTRAHAAELLNSLGAFSNSYFGTKFGEIKKDQVASYELAEKQLAGMAFDTIARTQGGAGRSRFAAKFLQESMANLNEAPQAVMGVISLMKQQYQRDMDYYEGMSPFMQNHRSMTNYLSYFNQQNSPELYDLRAVLEAKGVRGSDIDAAMRNPAIAKQFDEDFGYGAIEMLKARNGRQP